MTLSRGGARAQDPMGHLFVSQSSQDAPPADSVATALREAGHSVFLDADPHDGIAIGAEWRRTLFRELNICHAVVFLNSRASQASTWCCTELAVADELGEEDIFA